MPKLALTACLVFCIDAVSLLQGSAFLERGHAPLSATHRGSENATWPARRIWTAPVEAAVPNPHPSVRPSVGAFLQDYGPFPSHPATALHYENDWRTHLALWSVLTIGTAIYAATGFGSAIAFHLLWGLVGKTPVEAAQMIAIYQPLMMFCQATRFVAADELHPGTTRVASVYGTAAVVGMVPGVLVLLRVPPGHSDYALAALGFVVLCVFLANLLDAYTLKRKTALPIDVRAPLVACVIAAGGLTTGFLRGFLGVGGPTGMLLVLLVDMSKDQWRQVAALADTPFVLLRLAVLYSASAFTHVHGTVWLVVPLALFPGLLLGNWVTTHVSQAQWRSYVLTLLFVCSTLFLFKARDVWVASALFAAGAALGAAALFLALWVRATYAHGPGPLALLRNFRWYRFWVRGKVQASRNYVHGFRLWVLLANVATHQWRCRPDLLIVGVRKCGTSALYAYLSQHADVVTGLSKEFNLLSGNSPFRTDFCDLAYLPSFFPLRAVIAWFEMISQRPKRVVYSGVFDFCIPWMPAAFANFCPQAQVVVCLRDPIERALSQYAMERRRWAGAKPYPPFAEQVHLSERQDREYWAKTWPACVQARSFAPAWEKIGSGGYHECYNSFDHELLYQARYHEHLLRVCAALPRAQVHLVAAERLRMDPRGETNRVLAACGLGPLGPETDLEPVNVGVYDKRIDRATFAFLVDYYEEEMRALSRDFDFPEADHWVARWHARLKEWGDAKQRDVQEPDREPSAGTEQDTTSKSSSSGEPVPAVTPRDAGDAPRRGVWG